MGFIRVRWFYGCVETLVRQLQHHTPVPSGHVWIMCVQETHDYGLVGRLHIIIRQLFDGLDFVVILFAAPPVYIFMLPVFRFYEVCGFVSTLNVTALDQPQKINGWFDVPAQYGI